MAQSRWKRVLLTLAVGLFAFIGIGGWAFASPVGASPDDDFHLASIWCSWGEREGLCEAGSEATVREVPHWLTLSAHCYAFHEDQSAACVPTDTELAGTTRVNSVGTYPPVFYATMGVFAGDDVALSVVTMRLLNTLIFVGATIAVVALMGRGQRAPVIWGAVVGLVPIGVFFIASVNPSSWAILAGLTVWVTLYGYFTADSRGRSIGLGVLAALLGIMGAGARSDSAGFVAMAAVIAMFLSYQKTRTWLLRALLPVGLMVTAAVSVLSSGQTSWAVVAGAEAIVEPSKSLGRMIQLAITNLVRLPELWAGNLGFGKLGWLDTPLLPTVGIVMVAAFGAIVFWGFKRLTARKLIALTVTLLALIALPLYVLNGQSAVVGTEVQPRYILPLMLMFIGLAVSGFGQDNLGLGRVQGACVLVAVAVANSLAMHTNMQRYLAGLDVGGLNLNTGIEWWWSFGFSPMAVWLVSSAAFALMMLGIYLLLFIGNRVTAASPAPMADTNGRITV